MLYANSIIPKENDAIVLPERRHLRIKEVLSRTANGIVLLAQPQIGNATRNLILKTLTPERTDADRFELECTLARQLSCMLPRLVPNVEEVCDDAVFKPESGVPQYLGKAMVMERVSGKNLRKHTEDCVDHAEKNEITDSSQIADHWGLNFKGALPIAFGLTRLVQSMHEVGIVHRDIKPRNVMVTPHDYGVKLIDFGLSCPVGDDKFYKRGMLVGSPGYIAPESIFQDRADFNPASVQGDIYGIGATIYAIHCAGGENKFKGINQYIMALNRGIIDIPEVRRDSPLVSIIKRTMCPLDDRYATIDELLSDLVALIHGVFEHHNMSALKPQLPVQEAPVATAS